MSKLAVPLFVLITSSALILMKLGTRNGAPIQYLDNRLHLNLNAFTIGGVLLYGCSFLLYTYLLSKYELGYIIPLTTALVYTIIFVASHVIFHEQFTLIKVVAIVFIMSGLALLNFKS